MRGRALIAAIVVFLVAAGCGSGAKKSSAPRAGATVLGLAGLGATGANGVVAVGSATQNVRADLAFVVVTEGGDGFGSTNGSLGGSLSVGGINIPSVPLPTTPSSIASAGDHDAIRAALRPLGIGSAAIEFSRPDPSGNSAGPGGPTVQIEVPVAKLPKIAAAVVTAMKKAGVTVASQGMRFGVLDCAAAISTARDQAVADAHKRAQALATAAGVTLGELTSVSEGPAQSSPLSYLSNGATAPCGRSATGVGSNLGGVPLAAFDAEPQVALTESIAASYALPATADRTVATVGVGEVSGPADAADILILPSLVQTLNPSGTSAKIDRAQVLHALAPLGVEKKDVEIENPISVSPLSSDSSTYVRVHVSVARLKAIGAKVVSAVQSIVGTDGSAGVLFSAKNCSALLARAQAAAVADAGKRLDKLALAANVRTGPIVGMAESGISTIYFPSIDPCAPNFDSLSGIGLLGALASGSSGPGIPSLAGLDATPQVTEQVTLSISRALS